MKLLTIAQWVTGQDVLETMDLEPILPDKMGKLNPPSFTNGLAARIDLGP